MPKIKKIKNVKSPKVDEVKLEEGFHIEEVGHDPIRSEELDPEVLEAINARKKKKKIEVDKFDYIPERELGVEEFDNYDDDDF